MDITRRVVLLTAASSALIAGCANYDIRTPPNDPVTRAAIKRTLEKLSEELAMDARAQGWEVSDLSLLKAKVSAISSAETSIQRRHVVVKDESDLQDAAITQSVKWRLVSEFIPAGDALKIRRLDVKTIEGTVSLTGYVATLRDKALAEEVAAKVTGVTTIVNDLKVESGPGGT